MADQTLRLYLVMLTASCIEPAASNKPVAEILNSFNESSCLMIDGKSSSREVIITNLYVNKTCVDDSEVSTDFEVSYL